MAIIQTLVKYGDRRARGKCLALRMARNLKILLSPEICDAVYRLGANPDMGKALALVMAQASPSVS